MKPLFSYYGGKHRIAKKYGPPRFDLVVEPFAGSAGYSSYWEPEQVLLIEKSEIVHSVWDFLIGVSEKEIMDIPDIVRDVDVDMNGFSEGAKSLVGFWLGKAQTYPRRRAGSWALEYNQSSMCRVWGPAVKERLCRETPKIKEWKLILGSYETAPDIEAHWHVDPPYFGGKGSKYHKSLVNYQSLSDWCRARKGWIEVCESSEAHWMPFEELVSATNCRKATYTEMVWTRETDLEGIL